MAKMANNRACSQNLDCGIYYQNFHIHTFSFHHGLSITGIAKNALWDRLANLLQIKEYEVERNVKGSLQGFAV